MKSREKETIVSMNVTVVGNNTNELTELFRQLGVRASSLPLSELPRLAQSGSRPPQVIVLDLRDISALPPAVALLKKEHPSMGFVIVAGKLDPALMLEAMRAGVNEWVTIPLKSGDLAAAIGRVAGSAPKATAGQLFAVTGAKGGVGSTTVAVNIATSLSIISKRSTLLIDAHPAGGDAALFLGAEPAFSLADALENTHRLDETFLKGLVVKTANGPDLLASPDRVRSMPIESKKLHAVVDFALRCYRFVVLDAPRADAGLDDTLDLASSIVVVTTQELAAIRSGGRAAAALRERYGAERVQIVVNRYDPSADIR
ncbi:MAG TPA: AAA family ATPase, partial [Vicinamibacterales bacterium]|nr:AAA family ATPase [Vicinamibacterales bacterium]